MVIKFQLEKMEKVTRFCLCCYSFVAPNFHLLLGVVVNDDLAQRGHCFAEGDSVILKAITNLETFRKLTFGRVSFHHREQMGELFPIYNPVVVIVNICEFRDEARQKAAPSEARLCAFLMERGGGE